MTEEAATREDFGRGWLRSLGVELALALQFLTAVPALYRREASAGAVGRSMALFPVVGLLLGGFLAALDALIGLVLPDPIRSALVVTAGLVATRGLHLDGLADTCDGLFGGWTPERRLEIMRDSRVGSFGVIAVVADVALRVCALTSLPAGARATAILLAVVLGRWALVYVTGAFPYARPTGLGAAFKAALTTGRLVAATLLAAAAVALVAATLGLPAGVARFGGVLLGAGALGLVAFALAALCGRYALTKIPGLTGDTYGATNEVVELAVLVVLVSAV